MRIKEQETRLNLHEHDDEKVSLVVWSEVKSRANDEHRGDEIKWLKIINILLATFIINSINVLVEPVKFLSETLRYWLNIRTYVRTYVHRHTHTHTHTHTHIYIYINFRLLSIVTYMIFNFSS